MAEGILMMTDVDLQGIGDAPYPGVVVESRAVRAVDAAAGRLL